MTIFVDYNNVEELCRRKGVTYVIDRILAALGSAFLSHNRRISFRLYDGWYELTRLTRYAQLVSAEVQASFPLTRTYSSANSTFSVLVNVELAYSILHDPTNHIWHTFRPRERQRNIACLNPVSEGCAIPQCSLLATHSFFANGKCPAPGCTFTPQDIILRNEQKLVDTMIATDLFWGHLMGEMESVIVTSDDDFWPVIKLLVTAGRKVVHIHTKPKRKTPTFYTRGIGRQLYLQLHM